MFCHSGMQLRVLFLGQVRVALLPLRVQLLAQGSLVIWIVQITPPEF